VESTHFEATMNIPTINVPVTDVVCFWSDAEQLADCSHGLLA
jgi:hypothetical protein